MGEKQRMPAGDRYLPDDEEPGAGSVRRGWPRTPWTRRRSRDRTAQLRWDQRLFTDVVDPKRSPPDVAPNYHRNRPTAGDARDTRSVLDGP
jgi:hypothetical protein